MVSTATISQYLEGLDFPATKEEVLEYAEERSASSDVMDILRDMPEGTGGKYYSMASIWDAAGQLA